MSEEKANSSESNDQVNAANSAIPCSLELGKPDTQKSDKDELEQLQKEKLRAEIADLKRPLLKKITFWPPALTFGIALLTYGYLVETGTFNAIQAHLTYVTDTLRTYKNHLDTIVKIQDDSSKVLSSEIYRQRQITDSLHQKIGAQTDLIRQYDSALKLKDSELSKKSAYAAALLRQIKNLQDEHSEQQKALDFYSPFAQRSVYATNSDCKIVDISKIPGYSDRSRYFRMDRGSSFVLSSRGFGIYLAGGPDSYIWDSVRQCEGKYVMYFNKELPQEVMPYTAAFEFERHHITLLNQVGILNGRYDLLFDFGQNESSNVVPKEDVGTWRIFGYPNRIIIHENKMIEFGDSAHLEQFRIDHIKLDRIDDSELYFTHTADNNQQQFIIKHGLKMSIILYGADRPEVNPFLFMVKL